MQGVCISGQFTKKTAWKNAWRFLHLHPPPARWISIFLGKHVLFPSRFQGPGDQGGCFFPRFVSKRWGKSECLGIWEVLSWCCMTWWWFPCTLDGILLMTDSFVLRLQATDPFSTENKPLIYSFGEGGWNSIMSLMDILFLLIFTVSFFHLFHHNVTSFTKSSSFPKSSIIPSFHSIPFKALFTSSTAQGGGGSFKNRKRIGEIDCCEWRMSEQKHWPTD